MGGWGKNKQTQDGACNWTGVASFLPGSQCILAVAFCPKINEVYIYIVFLLEMVDEKQKN